ncbi:MAG: hypothetical protein P1U63_06000 [Coxiellaceae bacterium]|nr:hypothetical protein [Coxiellaceae bacterium]
MRKKWINIGKVIVCASLYISTATTLAAPQPQLIPSNTILDREVLDVVEDKPNNALYVAGWFSGLYEKLVGGAIFHSDGHLNKDHKLNFQGQPFTSISDHHGGFYVGGTFSNINTTGIKYLVHIFSDGMIDTNFKPSIPAAVYHVSLVNDNLYASTHFHVYKINLSSGQIDTGFAISTPDNNPGKLRIAMLATENGVYVGGNFTQINGHSVSNLAKANLDTGAIDTGFYRSNAAINGITSSSDGKLYLIVNNRSKFVEKVDQITGVADENFKTDISYKPSLLAVDDGMLYVGSRVKPLVSRYNAITGEKDNSLTISTITYPSAFAFDDRHIYIAAYMTARPGSRYYRNLGRFDKVTQEMDDSYVANVDRNISTMALSEGKLFTGGYFKSGGQNQGSQGLIKFNLTTGLPDPTFKPQLNGSVSSVTFDDNYVYVGGTFTKADNVSTGKLAKLNKTTGTADKNFRPQPNGYINRLKVHDGYLYVGGHFSKISGRYTSKGFARYKLDPLSYDNTFHPHFNHMVWALAFAGDSLYVGGTFTNRVEKYNIVSGEKDLNFNPITPAGQVRSLLIDGDNLYVVGYYWDGIHKMNRFTGLADTAFRPGVERALWSSVAKHDGYIYVGGKNTLLRLDETTGAVDSSFNPQPNGYVYGTLFDGNTLTAFGTFTKLQGEVLPYLATIPLNKRLRRFPG